MGTGKKEQARRERQGKTGDGFGNLKVKGENFYRSAKRVKALNVRTHGLAQRNAAGQITQAAVHQSRDVPTARVEPNRKWFTNTRVISQDSLASFREAVENSSKDPYQVLLKTNKLPMTLIRDGGSELNGLKQHQAKMTIETSPFAEVFGPKASRKRVKLGASTIEDLAGGSEQALDTYQERLEQARLLSGESGGQDGGADGRQELDGTVSANSEPVFDKGQSKRIWNELYKVIDSSDVLLHVLDARDPLGTRCRSVEKYIKEEAPHKHLIFVLNKVDLVPTKVCAQWVKVLSKEYPTLAFRSSITNSFGKGSLIQLLRQFSILHSDRKQVSVGLVGYPSVGKSSVINTLRAKAVAKVSPTPGETKVWQYITLMKRIYLIDCPGIVPPSSTDTPEDLLLRGVVRLEKVEQPEQYIRAVLDRVKPHHAERTYQIQGWNDDATRFLEILARKGGRLLKGGEPDVDSVAKMVLNDFTRGRLPWFTAPPHVEGDEGDVKEGRQGRLGEMPKKRKYEPEVVPATPAVDDDGESAAEDEAVVAKDKDEDEDSFEGFDDDSDSDNEAIEEAKKAAVMAAKGGKKRG
ncbi:nucleolar GTP-binding protein 2 [Apiospora kogelbergensis]|uniref:Nucleolar GTP-binding protein 2 n=1 Tax=Apiospora kogelbergensis TaxID=1337665 RepID=A0AAW0RC12_9PEZI